MRRATRILSAVACVAVAMGLSLAAAPSALALQVRQHAFASSFDGTANPELELADVAVNQETGNVYTLDGSFFAYGGAPPAEVDQFDSTGNPVAFSALAGSNRLLLPNPAGGRGGSSGIAVDNSGTATQGRIYVASSEDNPGVYAYEPSGSPVGGNFPIFGGHPCGVAVDSGSGDFWVANYFEQEKVIQYTPAGIPTGVIVDAGRDSCRIATDSEGNLYAASNYSYEPEEEGGGTVKKFNSSGEFEGTFYPRPSSGVAIDPATGDIYISPGEVAEYNSSGTEQLSTFGVGSEGIAVDGASEDVYEASGAVQIYAPGATLTLPGAIDDPGSEYQPSSLTLDGTVSPEGIETTKCYFEWGETPAYGNIAPCAEGNVLPGFPEDQEVHAHLTGLTQGTTYHYRLVAANKNGMLSAGDATFIPSTAPALSISIAGVHAESAALHGLVNPGGAPTTYRFQYGTEDCETSDSCLSTAPASAGNGLTPQAEDLDLTGLSPDTTYHVRILAENQAGKTVGTEYTFTTFPRIATFEDHCPNAHVRQQTGAAFIPDCRAYELVSAADTGGYDVESDLVEEQTPFASYPEAENPPRVLYAVHDGGIPGTDHPTNRGVDPYVATRTENGWTTEYVGVRATNPFATAPFSSVPSGADANLETFAFGGPEGCSPCFEGDYTGIPVHLSDGKLVQGMVAGEGVATPPPSAKPDGYIAKDLSPNGEHLIFGSTTPFAAGGNSGGPVSLYDRNLRTEETHVVSNAPGGGPLPCLQHAAEGECHAPKDSNGISELAISSDGSHVLLGQKVSEDADHNVYWHLYMDVNDSPESIELTQGATEGVLFDGMTADGSRVFFTTKDQSLPSGPASSNLYEAEVTEFGANLSLIASGAGSCAPVSNANGAHWNSLESANCGPLAIGGGGGVAAGEGADGAVNGDGTLFFLSPQTLEAGHGTENQPNLYFAAPGSAPRFIATLSPEDPVVLDSVSEAEQRHTADFQVAPSGSFAVFTTVASLSQYQNAGYAEVYRYDDADSHLACASCAPTNETATSDSTLAPNGSSLSEDGRVFFDSTDALAPRALNEKQDVYEWEEEGAGTPLCEDAAGCLDLISTGTSPFPSSLLGASANGTDVYFFTRDSLVPQDKNGQLVKIYDAREGGGFPYIPEPPPCKASDECHGPGSPAPQQPTIDTVTGSLGNQTSGPPSGCKPGYVKKHGRCLKKPKHPRHHKPAHHKRGGRK